MSLDISPAGRLALKRYLLGQLSSVDQDQVEERFEDPAYFAEYQAVERLLVQEYASGTMAPIEAELFAKHYLVTRKRRDQVAIVRALLEVHSNAPTIEHARSKRFEKWIPVLAMAASVIVAAIGWSHWRSIRVVQKATVRPIESPIARNQTPPQTSPSQPRSEAHRVPSQGTPAPTSAGRDQITPPPAPSAPDLPAPEPALTSAKPVREKELVPEYALTRVTADQSDITKAGDILVLQKGDLVMAPVAGANLYQDTYKDGKIKQNSLGMINMGSRLLQHGTGTGAVATRIFVPGEKMWVTKIQRKDDGLVFDLLTDEYAGVRYKAALKFYFNPKGPALSVDEMGKLVGEVFKVQAARAGEAGGPKAAAPDGEAAAGKRAAAPAPSAAPTQGVAEITLGQSVDQVMAILGQPRTIIDLGSKKVYEYKDMKVVFIGGKVVDVQ
jgi:hypothetical protein